MEKIGFIGAYDKTDLILYIARTLVAMGKKVLVVDSTITQKAKYVVPVINPTTTYVTEFEEIDVAVGFASFEAIKDYLGLPQVTPLDYDIALVDIDNSKILEQFNMAEATRNYFVTSFDLYSLKKGLEILFGLTKPIRLTKVLFSKEVLQEDDDYLNFLSLGMKIELNEEKIYFPFELGDESVIAENQRVSKIKYRKLSTQYKEGLLYILEQILDKEKPNNIRKAFRQLEKNV